MRSALLLLTLPLLAMGSNHPHVSASISDPTFQHVFGDMGNFGVSSNSDGSQNSGNFGGSSGGSGSSGLPASQTPSSSSSGGPPESQAGGDAGNEECTKLDMGRLHGFQGSEYFFSLLDEDEHDRKNDWWTARRFCQFYCMDLVSIDSPQELQFIERSLRRVPNDYHNPMGVWTGGFLCEAENCTSKLPFMTTPWRFASTGRHVASAIWSRTGEAALAQPDNFSHRIKRESEPEDCLALLRNWFKDGFTGHDRQCSEVFPFVCEAKIPRRPSGYPPRGGGYPSSNRAPVTRNPPPYYPPPRRY